MRKRIKKVETIHGVFDSGAEARRYAELVLLEKAGTISGLVRQVEFDLVVNGELIGRYTPDFCYRVNGELVAEEYKGLWKADAKLRVKIFMALYKDEVRFVVSGTPMDRRRKGCKKIKRRRGR